MLLTATLTEPILVAHPKTGDQINVAPLFDAIDQLGGKANTPADLRHIMGRLIVTMGITVHDPQITSPQALASLNSDMFRLYEMFSRMVA